MDVSNIIPREKEILIDSTTNGWPSVDQSDTWRSHVCPQPQRVIYIGSMGQGFQPMYEPFIFILNSEAGSMPSEL